MKNEKSRHNIEMFISEWCPNCETEVQIPKNPTSCPKCDCNILPCTLCDCNVVSCNSCVWTNS